MKNKILIIISSIGISVLYLIAKFLISTNEDNLIYTGGILAIIAGIIAFTRFTFYRKAYKFALNEFANIISTIYIIWNPHPLNTGNDRIINIFIVIGGILTILYFGYLYLKSNNPIGKLEDLATIFLVIAGSSLLIGYKIISLLFSGIGYYLTGRFEDKNIPKDQIYTWFCYLSAILSTGYGIYKLYKGFT